MVGVDIAESGNVRKRKRKFERRIIVNEKVEVRSLEDGFLGSWHSGTVIACRDGVRHVMYDHLLLNDGSDYLVDAVSVSAILDNINASIDNSYFRGYIRPIPPKIDFGRWNLPYGLCVDVYYQDAWWEGVIFDHGDGLEERRVFFPDLGDELKVRIETFRISQDWDEATGIWQRRGAWSFLELIDQFERECYLAVSLKQIWYEVRAKKGFMKIREWTFPVNDLWKELVMEVIDENLDITLKELLRVLEIPSSVSVKLDGTNFDIDKNPLVNLVDCDAIVTTGHSVKCDMMISNGSNQENALDSCGLVMEEGSNFNGSDENLPDTRPSSPSIYLAQEKSRMDDVLNKTSDYLGLPSQDEALSALVSKTDGFPGANSTAPQQVPVIRDKIVQEEQLKCSGHGSSFDWKPLSGKILPDAAMCPDAVAEYLLSDRRRRSSDVIHDVRKHILYLDWRIESREDRSIFRYASPDGKYFYSLRQVCNYLMKPSAEIPSSISQIDTGVLHSSCDDILASEVLKQRERSSSPENSCQAPVDSSAVVFKPEFFNKGVIDYNLDQIVNNGMKNTPEMRSKARSHLFSCGWRIMQTRKGNRQRWFYTSPPGKTYSSLPTACKAYLDKQIDKGTYSACRSGKSVYLIENTNDLFVRNEVYSAPCKMDVQGNLVPSNAMTVFSEGSPGMSISQDVVEFSKNRFQQIRNQECKANLVFPSHLLQNQYKLKGQEFESGNQLVGKKYIRRIRNSGTVTQKVNRENMCLSISKFADDKVCRRSTHMLRSRKRVQKVVNPSPSHHNPKTVLSWLIDNNVLLPRARVYYSSKKGICPVAEGRVSRNGIKCCCCQKIFTLNGFAIHAGAGRSSSLSAASIFLEDGRSLLDCQILCNKKIRGSKREACDYSKAVCSKGENDYICSICHFGGILILCDQCPSSFHQSCLGLKDIPEGDWYCPSCCCGICGQNRFNEEDTYNLDYAFLACHQCERRYHVKCLEMKGASKCGSHPKARNYWFCSEECEEIHCGLQRLLGKSIPVGGGDLTWSILKATNSDTYHLNPPNLETLTENQSKLNLALSVMHECFEPVKETLTRRDLVEDVIFSRRSELKRLNFQGFYTVLLERNDELISVASIRVYGKKVAEIPLVGTRFQYRRLGMCRILMHELEMKLRELGVQRLVLPAVSSVLNTWTTSFGFSKMTDSERLEFLDFTFLDFQETIMCQKFLLRNNFVPTSLTGKPRVLDDFNKPSNSTVVDVDVDGSSAVTEAYQTAHTEESSVVGHGQKEISAGNNNRDNSPFMEVIMVTNNLQSHTSAVKDFPVRLAERYKDFEGLQESADDYKCYSRRRKLVSLQVEAS